MARAVNGQSGQSAASERMRTRLTDAAQAQLRDGGPMTVAAVAARAGVSRATAYRHFLNNDAVLLWATRPTHGQPLLPPPTIEDAPPGTDLTDRAEALIRATARWAFEHERELRAVLAVSLTLDRGQQGRSPRKALMQRDRWIAELLTDLPPHVPPATRARLAAALVPLFGSDAVGWTRDAADLTVPEAIDILVWMARALITAALAESDPTPPRLDCGIQLS
ncbi:TetR family transcriptional regulator [Pseudonocardia sp.]|jgi:AcrR family transcriptional regulator|uniref:TetR family transcriptional regulator n=1 Tax=Pseudonocardia sp. TaxID=60912 RepID=UPI002637E914|nr:TetR family transcriptional regulator [Pseudonocardia sp.]